MRNNEQPSNDATAANGAGEIDLEALTAAVEALLRRDAEIERERLHGGLGGWR